jgi:thymidylate synthase
MKQYLDLPAHVLEHGPDRGDRTGTATCGITVSSRAIH